MESKPEMTSDTNPVLSQILKRYVNADSVCDSSCQEPGVKNDTDWYNMTCLRCPWFIDGAKTGEYATVSNSTTADDTADDPASDNDAAPDNAQTTEKHDTGDSGRVYSDDSQWDEECDELLDDVDAKCDENDDIIGLNDSDSDLRRVPIIRCERPDTVECLNDSLFVRLLIASGLIREQAALKEAMSELEVTKLVTPTDDVNHMSLLKHKQKSTKRTRRSLNLRRASKKRGR